MTDINTITVQRDVGMAAEGTGSPAEFMMLVGNVFNVENLARNNPVEYYKEAQSQYAFPQA